MLHRLTLTIAMICLPGLEACSKHVSTNRDTATTGSSSTTTPVGENNTPSSPSTEQTSSRIDAETTIDSDGIVAATAAANPSRGIFISANGNPILAKTGLYVPPGALSAPLQVKISEGLALAEPQFLAELGLRGVDTTKAGTAVALAFDHTTNIKAPLELSLPLPRDFSLTTSWLTTEGDREKLVVLGVLTKKDGSSSSVLLPPSSLVIAEGSVRVKLESPGVYQVAVLDQTPPSVITERATQRAALNIVQAKQDKNPPGAFQILTLAPQTLERGQASFTVTWEPSSDVEGRVRYGIFLPAQGPEGCGLPTKESIMESTFTTSFALSSPYSGQAGTYLVCLFAYDQAGNRTAATNNGDVSLTVTQPVISVKTIAVTTNVSHLISGHTVNMHALATYSDGSTKDVTQEVTWTSSNASIAMMGAFALQKNLAAAIATGSVTISATLEGITGSITLDVLSPPTLTTITVSPLSSIATGDQHQLAALAVYSDASTSDVTQLATWSSSAPGILAVSNDEGKQGLVTALSSGSAAVTATMNNIQGETSITVTVPVLRSISLAPHPVSSPLGVTQNFTATGLFSDSTSQNVTSMATWESSMPSVATVSNDSGAKGLATGASVGTTLIRAKVGLITGQATLSVTPKVLTYFDVTPSQASIAKGSTQAFTAIGHYTDGSTQDITSSVLWSSADTSIATMGTTQGNQGRASAIAMGTVTITASFGDESHDASLMITIPPRSTPLVATLSNAPSGSSAYADVDITVGGTDVTSYQATWSQDSTCSGVSFASVSETPIATHFTAHFDSYNGTATLCVIGLDAEGRKQTTPTIASWTMNFTPPSVASPTLINDASDGEIDLDDRIANLALISGINVLPGQTLIGYQVIRSDLEQCPEAASTTPPSASSVLTGAFKVCAKVRDTYGRFGYGSSTSFHVTAGWRNMVVLGSVVSDGYLSLAEKIRHETLVAYLQNPENYTLLGYQIISSTQSDCSQASDTTNPTTNAITQNGSYRICAKVSLTDQSIIYGVSLPFTAVLTVPSVSDLVLDARAADGTVNIIEKSADFPLVTTMTPPASFTLSGYAIIGGSDLSCPYTTATAIPRASSYGQGSYRVCARVTDVAGNVLFALSDSFYMDESVPNVDLANAPQVASAATELDITVSGDNDVSHYRFLLGDGSTTCRAGDLTGYGTSTAVGTKITADLGEDGNKVLCVIGGPNAVGNYGLTVATWKKTSLDLEDIVVDGFLDAAESAGTEVPLIVTPTGLSGPVQYALVDISAADSPCGQVSSDQYGDMPHSSASLTPGAVYKVCGRITTAAGSPPTYSFVQSGAFLRGSESTTVPEVNLNTSLFSMSDTTLAATERAGSPTPLIEPISLASGTTATYALIPQQAGCTDATSVFTESPPTSDITSLTINQRYKVCLALRTDATTIGYSASPAFTVAAP